MVTIIYLHRGMAHTSAESEDTAARLEAQGWVRCTFDVWTALRRIDEDQRYAELKKGARAQVAPQNKPLSGVLYKVRWEKVEP